MLNAQFFTDTGHIVEKRGRWRYILQSNTATNASIMMAWVDIKLEK